MVAMKTENVIRISSSALGVYLQVYDCANFHYHHVKGGKVSQIKIITHLAGQTYVRHGCKWNFARPQIYLQPAKIKSQHFRVFVKVFGL